MPIEPSGSHECSATRISAMLKDSNDEQITNVLIQTFWEICRADDNNPLILPETVHLDKQLIQRLFQVLLVASVTLATDCVQLVDKDNSRLFLACKSKQIA